jgi:hypothetical protein
MMTGTPAGRRLRLALWGLLAAAVALCALSPPALAVGFEKGSFWGSWDSTITYGTSWRLEDPDPELIGLANGGDAFSVNGDDGNLNYDRGIWSNVIKLTTEIELNYKDVGFFVRGRGFFDYESNEKPRERTDLSSEARDLGGAHADLLDAYFWVDFDIAGKPAEFRVGEQVLSWGESTFIQNSINVINHVDVSALRVPGAELREALLPQGMVWFSFTMTQNTSLEVFALYDWDEVEIDPPGSYFATNDFVGNGGDTVFLGFGSSPDIPPFSDPTAPDRPFLGVPRDDNQYADDDGQYGIALRWFVPALGETEFGFYFMNYHSRLPTINARTGSVNGAITAGTIGASAVPIVTAVQTHLAMFPGDIPGAVGAGTVAGVGAGAPLGSSQAIAGTSATGGDVASVTSAFAVDAYAQTAAYYLAYPEDIKLYGASFNTQLGTSGVALQGEVSFRQDAPFQVDDVELLFAALAPINPVFAGNSGIPGEPGASQLVAYNDEDYSTQFETEIEGFIELDVAQAQMTATKVFGPTWGASTAVLVTEVAMTHVLGMPDKTRLRLEGPGTYTSGNAYHSNPASPGAGHAGKSEEQSRFFADPTSWGYRLAGRLDYNNAMGAVNLSPRFSWQHDVNGNSPGPGGNFIEERKALTVGLMGTYQNTWSADMSYTRYFGAGRHNLINDRDFIAANLKYSF